jgi:hypothetical protein
MLFSKFALCEANSIKLMLETWKVFYLLTSVIEDKPAQFTFNVKVEKQINYHDILLQ